jgi:iron complex outermembrane receptor protein
MPILLCCAPFIAIQAQDSTLILPQLTVSSTRFEQNGFKRWTADSLPVLSPVFGAQRLSWDSPLSVRITAPGTLATVSARGMGPTHTPVFWNGLNLQSSMNGVVDVSLLPIWPEDQLELRSGGQSAGLGSGAMGGSVLLETNMQQAPGFSGNLGVQAGSFGQQAVQSSLGYQDARWSMKVRGNWQQARNDFPFVNTTKLGRPVERQQSNSLHKTDYQQFIQYRVNARHTFNALFWQQNAFRAIPQPITAAPRESWQQDRAHRALLSWIYCPDARTLVQSKVAWLDEWIAFRLSGNTETSFSRTLLASSEITRSVARSLSVKMGANGIQQWARSDGYADSTRWYQQLRLAAFAEAAYHVGRLKLTGLIRQEWAQYQSAPFTWSLGGNIGLFKLGALSFHTSRNFNMPTFNDRFWMAYGQSGLASEHGYSTDLSWKTLGRFVQTEITAFQITIDDWILWQPGNDGIFRPGNLKKVRSHGLEAALKCPFKVQNWHFNLQTRYQLNRTSNIAVYNNATSSLSRQLLYVPIHSGSLLCQAQWRSLSFAYTQQFTGKRYIQSDNSRSLPGFQTGTFYTAFQFGNPKKCRLAFDFRIENCWNHAYSFLAFQPMPGRSFQGGFRFSW